MFPFNFRLTLFCVSLSIGCTPESRKTYAADLPTVATQEADTSLARDIKAAVSRPSGGNWSVRSDSDPMDDVTNVYLSLEAVEPLSLAFPYNDKTASLEIRCFKNKTQVYVITYVPAKTAYDDDYTELGSRVRVRFDGNAPTASYWSESTDHAALFSPEPTALAKKLARTREWLFEFTPYDAAPTTATFRTEGLAEVLPKVRDACHWNK